MYKVFNLKAREIRSKFTTNNRIFFFLMKGLFTHKKHMREPLFVVVNEIQKWS